MKINYKNLFTSRFISRLYKCNLTFAFYTILKVFLSNSLQQTRKFANLNWLGIISFRFVLFSRLMWFWIGLPLEASIAATTKSLFCNYELGRPCTSTCLQSEEKFQRSDRNLCTKWRLHNGFAVICVVLLPQKSHIVTLWCTWRYAAVRHS